MKTFKLLPLSALFLLVMSTSLQAQVIDGDRPNGKDGLLEYEVKTAEVAPFTGIRVRTGGFFSQDFQILDHSNEATPNIVNGVDLNAPRPIGNNFNTAQANWDLDVHLGEGVAMHLTTYLSSRHHTEAWVKGGYIQFDRLPFLPIEGIDKLMESVTIRVGHYDINFGDAHFRRTDGGNSFYNPFVENLIMDAFTTEIGGEIRYLNGGVLGVLSVTNGEINGKVESADRIAPAVIVKLGYDKQISEDLRVRLTGSMYTTTKSANNTLYSGDRTGSRYYLVLANAARSATENFTTGRFNPGFRSEVTAFVVNPFVKVGGLEVFGNIEFASGASATESKARDASQFAADVVYRFGGDEQYYVAGRYNRVTARQAGATADVSIDRTVGAVGMFFTSNVLAKLEYVNQNYTDFPTNDIYHKGNFKGLMISTAVAF